MDGSLEKLWKRYTVHTGGYIEFRVGTGGNLGAVLPVPVEGVVEAERLVKDAVSLLVDGKLPTEMQRRPVDPDKVMTLLAESYGLLQSYRTSSYGWQEADTAWVMEQENSEISTEGTLQQVVEQYDFFRECLSKSEDTLISTAADLPTAIEG